MCHCLKYITLRNFLIVFFPWKSGWFYSILFASSVNLQKGFANLICSGDLQSGSKIEGFETIIKIEQMGVLGFYGPPGQK